MTEDKRDWKRVVLGWAIDFDEEKPAAHAGRDDPPAEAVELALPTIDAGKIAAPKDGAVNVGEVFDLGGLSKDEVDLVDKAKELVKTLPADTPVEVKRQIVMASLKAFGVDSGKLIEAAVHEIRALEAYIRAGKALAAKHAAASEDRIKALQSEIAALNKQVEQHNADQEARARACTGQKLDVQRVLEFFGPDEVGRVVGNAAGPGGGGSHPSPVG